ncbi:acyltransferase [Mucilaginibacter sp. BT774]|uniref:acyltransferase family protein n=1 Tax=Mucilaginibacter sp. BT774 TaxID=3062276 RepID=UPI0026751E2E|nr:acyltransferase [Mucilaginibacter sp. BT774]MDO3627491.1 acyltransferase [Mucilaginibacter sp. BT774]
MRIRHIDALRGIAALMVTFFHLTGNTGLLKQTAALGQYGYLGVEVFFVISGFVLPYSLHKAQYQLKDFPTFLFKRILRIYPAYIVAIVISIVVTLMAGSPVMPWQGLTLHILFLNDVFGYKFISPVFWTLVVEFQFYILLGLLFQHLFINNYRSILLIMILLSFLLINRHMPFIPFFPFFALGILIYHKHFTGLKTIFFLLLSVAILIIIVQTAGIPEAIASSAAVLFILFVKPELFRSGVPRALLWLGTISYSLYLTHWELGRAVVSVCRRFPVIGGSETIRLIAGLTFSILCAYILYRFIEKPSINVSHKLHYKTKEEEKPFLNQVQP